jgi:hypothetical protein
VTFLCIAKAHGTQSKKVLDNEAAELGPTWFPEEKNMVSSEREKNNQSEIFRINDEGTGSRRSADKAFLLSNPFFCPTDEADRRQLRSSISQPKSDDFSIWLVDPPNQRREHLIEGSNAEKF